MTQENKAVIERALGIIEGIACGVSDAADSMLYTAIELIDGAVLKEEQRETESR